jgi:osmotically-inducible protein OsmY
VKTRPVATLSALVLCAVLAGATARAEDPARLSDDEVRAIVEHALLDEAIKGVDVTVSDGSVTLGGTVPNAWSRNEAEWLAFKTRDVKAVVNHLTVARAGTDAELAEAVTSQVRRYVLYSVFDDVEASVRDGKVSLTGEVTAGYKANDIARIASKVKGVQSVENDIRTLPASPFDEELRAALASRIYGDPLFESYSHLQVPPPVHIVVEGGHVTLTGAVDSKVERAKAGAIAREVFGVMSVDNQLRVTG